MEVPLRDLKFSVPKDRAAAFAVVWFVFAAVGVLYDVNTMRTRDIATDPTSLLLAIACFLAFVLFSLAGVSGLIALVSSQALLLVDDSGIQDTTSLFGGGLIRWEEIAELAEYRVVAQCFFAIVPRDTKTYISQQRLIPKVAMILNNWTTPAAINIPQSFLPVPVAEVVEQIRTNFAPELERYRISATIMAEEEARRQPRRARGSK